MRLNGAALNTRSLNAAQRLPVALAAEAALAVSPVFAATRVRLADGATPIVLAPELAPSAQRFGVAEFALAVEASMAQTVSRVGTGEAAIRFDGALFFAQTRYGSGDLEVTFEAKGDVGVAFGEGAAVIAPFEAELDGSRSRHGSGTAAIDVVLDFPASAIRRPAVSSATLLASLSAVLEPSHITGGGVRHIGMFGDLPVVLSMDEAGMNRQAHIGVLDVALVMASATGTLRKPTLAGAAANTVLLQAEFRTARHGAGTATTSVTASCDGAVFCRGTGDAPISVTAECTGQLLRKLQLGDVVVGVVAQVDFTRARAGDGAAVISISLTGGGAVVRRFSGEMVIEALSFSDAILNPDADDIAEQTFMRPASTRVLARPRTQREFTR